MQGLTQGQTQLLSKVLTPNTIRAAVFFTDGWPNILQDNFNCGGAKHGRFFFTAAAIRAMKYWRVFSVVILPARPRSSIPALASQTTLVTHLVPDVVAALVRIPRFSGSADRCERIAYERQLLRWPGSRRQSPLGSDAMYRAVKVAQAMQANDIYVYSIGMGTAITGANNESPRNSCGRSPTIRTPPPTIPICRRERRCLRPPLRS